MTETNQVEWGAGTRDSQSNINRFIYEVSKDQVDTDSSYKFVCDIDSAGPAR